MVQPSDVLPQELWAAANDAAAQCGYDPHEERLLWQKVIDIQPLTAEEVMSQYPWCVGPPGLVTADQVARVHWLTWAVPKHFDGRYETAVVSRSESIVVPIKTLIAREVYTYELGPEYNWLDWESHQPPAEELPPQVFEALKELIRGDWESDVLEYSEDVDNHLDDVHPSIKSAVSQVITGQGLAP